MTESAPLFPPYQAYKRQWTPERTAFLAAKAKEGLCAAEIADCTGMTIQSICSKAARSGILLPPPRPGSKYYVEPQERLAPVSFPQFEDMPAAVIEREWPTGRFWDWRPLQRKAARSQAQFSIVGNGSAMCVVAA